MSKIVGEIDIVNQAEIEVIHAIQKAADRETASRFIFAQHSIPDNISAL